MIIGSIIATCLLTFSVLMGTDSSSVSPGTHNYPSSTYGSSYRSDFTKNTSYYNSNNFYDSAYLTSLVNKLKEKGGWDKLKAGGSNLPGTNVGIDISSVPITNDDWNNFQKLVNENEEFNVYASQLFYSQAVNNYELLKNFYSKNKNCIYPSGYACILSMVPAKVFADNLGLKQRYVFHKHLNFCPETYVEFVKNRGSNIVENYNKLFEKWKNNGPVLRNNVVEIDDGERQLNEMVQNTVKGSLAFWNWKLNRENKCEYRNLIPVLDNGDQRCWLQSGFYMCYSLTESDDWDELGNWGQFLQYMTAHQFQKLKDCLEKRSSTDNVKINLLSELKNFCKNNYNYKSEEQRKVVERELNWLLSEQSNLGNDVITAINKFQNIFPELKRKKFDTCEAIAEFIPDPILCTYSKNSNSNKDEYSEVAIAVRHFIPGLQNINEGIGSDPAGVKCPNQYGKYKLKFSVDGKLQIYELKGMSIYEHEPEFKEVQTELFGEKCKQWTVLPAHHGRSVIKVGSSWYYYDTNDFWYEKATNIEEIFENKYSVMDYQTKYKLPVNHVGRAMYHLIKDTSLCESL